MALLSRLARLFTGETECDLAKNAGASASHVTHPDQIARLLERLKNAHAIVTVSVSGDEPSAPSTILRVDRKLGIVWFDELPSPEVHEAVLGSRSLKVRARLDGIEMVFTSELETVGKRDGLTIYQTKLPPLVRYYQRRAHVRVSFSPFSKIPVRLETPRGEVLHGYVHDLSEGGTELDLPEAAAGRIETWQKLPDCTLILPGNETIKAALEICRLTPRGEGSVVRLAGRFIGMASNHRKRLAQFLAEVERDKRRRDAELTGS